MLFFKKKLLHRNNKLMKRKVNKYKKAGVNINEGNNFIKLIKKKVFVTHTKGAVNDLNSFAGFFDLSILKYKNHFDNFNLNIDNYIHCAGGYRSMVTNSILKSKGIHNLIDIQGGFSSIKKTNIATIEYSTF